MSKNIFNHIKETARRFLGRYGISVRRKPRAFSLNPHDLVRVDFDFIVRDFLMSRETPHDVSFVEFGAFDGVHDDPLHDYISRYNWRGLLVEPQSFYFQQLRDVYSDHEELMLFNGAVARDSGYKTLYTVDPEVDDLPRWAGVFASFDRNTLLRGDPVSEDHVREEQVRVEPPMGLLKDNNLLDVDIVQIDVEGFDAQVVRMLDFNILEPHIVQFEHRFLSPSDHVDVVDILLSNGYKVARSGGYDTIGYKRT
jgi:FkbM family methyltransferase